MPVSAVPGAPQSQKLWTEEGTHRTVCPLASPLPPAPLLLHLETTGLTNHNRSLILLDAFVYQEPH